MPNPEGNFGASPDELTRDSTWIFEGAEFTKKVMKEYQTQRAALSTPWEPWGDPNLEGDDFAKDYGTTFTQLEEGFGIYMNAVVQATADTAEKLFKTGRNVRTTEDENEETAVLPDPRSGTGDGGRR
ncbi:hypothetical protein AB0I72_08805 [Nocardiopsis sp. NPDC049922]|uniref:hypothetical protein n=1 Tax=Nocardiopsis sp. NPDC049922 TaxID=3155157 RepID=UPI0033F68BDC